MSDDAFLRAILADPSDDATRLVYADWLDEQGRHNQAEFLRITATPPPPPSPPSLWARAVSWVRRATRTPDPRLPRLRELAALLDTDWLAVVSRLEIENCREERKSEVEATPGVFLFVCERKWAAMTPTDDVKVRHCETCRRYVYYCETIVEAREHTAERHCIAIDLGIPRRQGDAWREPEMIGEATLEELERRAEERRPDPVSEARQRRKDAGVG